MIDTKIYHDDKKKLGYSILKAEEMDNDGALAFLEAIFDRSKEDYISGKMVESVIHKNRNVESIRRYLHDDRSILGAFAPADPDIIIDNWNTQAEYQNWRIRNKCYSCKAKKIQYLSSSWRQKSRCW